MHLHPFWRSFKASALKVPSRFMIYIYIYSWSTSVILRSLFLLNSVKWMFECCFWCSDPPVNESHKLCFFCFVPLDSTAGVFVTTTSLTEDFYSWVHFFFRWLTCFCHIIFVWSGARWDAAVTLTHTRAARGEETREEMNVNVRNICTHIT